jgi:fido (protein-threonine AMPylation protein)
MDSRRAFQRRLEGGGASPSLAWAAREWADHGCLRSRFAGSLNDDPYVYRGTDALRNELGIRDGAELRRIEADLVYWRSLRLASQPITGDYDLRHLQAFHRFLFYGLYAWAGELRSVPLARTDLFLPA